MVVAGGSKIQIALDQGEGCFRLPFRGAVFFDKIPEIGDHFPVPVADGRVVVCLREERPRFLKLLPQPFRVFPGQFFRRIPSDEPPAVPGGVGHEDPGGVRGKGVLHKPVPGFVDNHLAAGHIFEIKGRTEGVVSMGRTVGLPVIMLVR